MCATYTHTHTHTHTNTIHIFKIMYLYASCYMNSNIYEHSLESLLQVGIWIILDNINVPPPFVGLARVNVSTNYVTILYSVNFI